MGRSKSARVELGGGLALEYLKGRGALRLQGPTAAAEAPLTDVLDQLGVRAADVLPSAQYLLFAGDAQPAGGIADLVAVYSSEDEAREAFRRLRLLPAARNGWAQLVGVRPNGRLEHVCWFGREPGSRPVTAPVRSAEAPNAPRRRLLRRRAQGSAEPEGDEPAKLHHIHPPGPARGSGGEEVSPVAAMLSVTLSRPGTPAAPPGSLGRRPRPGQRR